MKVKSKPILRAALWGLTVLAPISLAACYGGPMEPCEGDGEVCSYDESDSAPKDSEVTAAPDTATADTAVTEK